MPIPRGVAHFNKRVLNHVMSPIARRMPGFAVVHHTGRWSGRTYRSPVNLFRSADGYTVSLTYGPDADWVRNVRAAGGCHVETRGQDLHLVDPELVTDPSRKRVPLPVRPILGLLKVDHFLVFRAD